MAYKKRRKIVMQSKEIVVMDGILSAIVKIEQMQKHN